MVFIKVIEKGSILFYNEHHWVVEFINMFLLTICMSIVYIVFLLSSCIYVIMYVILFLYFVCSPFIGENKSINQSINQ